MFGHDKFEGHHWGIGRILAAIVGGVVIASIFALAFGWLVMVLWNWLMPLMFGLKTITYWQAFGFCILAKLLFGGMSGHHKGYRGHHDRFGCFRHGPKPWEHHHDDWVPAGDPRNWRYYRQYWTERGKQDFEEYLRKKDPTPGAE